MAKLNVLSRQPEKIVLGKGGSKGIGNLIGLVIFALVVCAGMSSLLEDGGSSNPVLVVIGLIVAISLLSAAVGALRSTRVVIDSQQRLATRQDTLFFLPARRQTMALNTIRDVQVSLPRIRNSSLRMSIPFWQVELRGVDGTMLLVNERGVHEEMRALAEEVGAILNRPVRDPASETSSEPARTQTRPTPESPYLQSSARQARQQAAASAPILAASARQTSKQSAADAAILQTSARLESQGAAANAPIVQTSTMQAYDQTMASAPIAETTARQTQDQRNAQMPVFETGMRMAFSQMSAFTSDVVVQAQMSGASAAASAPFVETSARLAQQQSHATYTVEYALPPMAGMAQMPTTAVFPPMMDLPALNPLGLDAAVPNLVAFPAPETRWDAAEAAAGSDSVGERQSSGGREDPMVQFRAARQLHAQSNFADAQAAYERALDGDPGSAAIHNDLGVLFFQQRKMSDAEHGFRKAIALDPFFAPGRYNLGILLQRLGNGKAAQEQFRLGESHTSGLTQDFQDALRGNVHAPVLSS